jgi:hypothetical protein
MSISKSVVPNDDVRILLERREEIKSQVNKLSKEYDAIGRILIKLHNLEEEQNKTYGEER